MSNPIVLNVDDLTEDIPALTSSFARLMQEAIVMCMMPHNHASGVLCNLQDLESVLEEVRIDWKTSYSERIRRAFGAPRNAAERAGEGIAILTILALTEYTVFERAPIGNGFDFWLSRNDEDDQFPFQYEAGLEAKGLSHAQYPSQIVRAVNDGIDQIKNSDNADLPAWVLATEFSRPVIYLVQL
ncbi:MAG: hypothetical protein OXT68_01370 [Chloroflexota bacterium]|nr:hypothetical protein [Chloroflexota bacterium]